MEKIEEQRQSTLEDVLDAEAEALNKEIAAEEAGGVTPSAPPAPDPEPAPEPALASESKPDATPAPAPAPELNPDAIPAPVPDVKTEITDEQRTKLGIPAKFKYMEDVVSWGTHAEKAKGEAENEKDKVQRETAERIAKMEETLQKTLDALTKQRGGEELTPEQREEINARLRQDLQDNPDAVFTQMFKKYDEHQEAKRQEAAKAAQAQLEARQAEALKQWKAEEDEMVALYGKDEYETKVKPAFQRIVQQRPYLQSVKEVDVFYRAELSAQMAQMKAESVTKLQEKKAAAVESGGRAEPQATEEDLMAKMDKAQSVAELDRLARAAKMEIVTE